MRIYFRRDSPFLFDCAVKGLSSLLPSRLESFTCPCVMHTTCSMDLLIQVGVFALCFSL